MRHELSGMMYKFLLNESNECKDITGFSFGNGPSYHQEECQRICSIDSESNHRWHQIVNGQYIEMNVNGVSTIVGLVNMVTEM